MTGALRFLTVLPLPGRHRAPTAATFVAFPLVGAVVGLVWVAVAGGDRLLPPPVLAALILVADALLTGGLHLDALADVADGAASRRPPDEALEVMRDPRVGAAGALALVLVCLVRWTALLPLVGAGWSGALVLVAAPVTGRVAMVVMLALLPPRGDDSLAAAVARPDGPVVAGACFLAALLCGLPGLGGLAALAAGFGVTAVFSAWWRARFGAVGGDAVGACGLLAETVALLTLAGNAP